MIGASDDIGIDAVQHQLGTTEHVEMTEPVEVSPREIQESFTTFALHRRTPEVERTISALDQIDVEFPVRGVGVGGNEFLGELADLDADPNVAVWRAVGTAEASAGQVVAVDDHSHDDMFARPDPLASAMPRRRRRQSAAASDSMVCNSTFAPAAMSSGEVYSSGL